MKLIYKNSDLIENVEMGEYSISFSLNINDNKIKKDININKLTLDKKYNVCYTYMENKNRILLQIAVNNQLFIYVKFIEDEIVYYLEKRSYLFGHKQEFELRNDHNEIFLMQTGTMTFALVKKGENGSLSTIAILNEILSNKNQNDWYNVEIDTFDSKAMQTISKINVLDKLLYVTYYPKRKKINISKINLNTDYLNDSINITSINRNVLKINDINTDYEFSFDFRKALKKEVKIIKTNKMIPENEIMTFNINKNKVYMYRKKEFIYASTDVKKAFAIKTNLKSFFLLNNLYIFGKYSNMRKKMTSNYDYIHIKNNTKPIGKFFRPFRNRGESFVLAKIKLNKLNESSEMHRGMYLGDENEIRYPLFMKDKIEDFEVYCKKRNKKNLIMLRANVGNGTSVSIFPYTKEYSFISSIKMKLAKNINNIIPKTKKYNLYFEKKSSKADESAIHVFTEVMERKLDTSKNYFILDKKSSNFIKLKRKYKRNLIQKNSFFHYYMIYRADYFIASELSNHVLNDRVFINDIRNKIVKTPLIFLQHGIMFAKPIDNPMARGFNKKNLGCNVVKTVISSRREAKEFYKVNYKSTDLLLTGLSTFDYASLDSCADKIAYMPTYRYWEEYLIYNNKMKETSYYKSIMGVIKIFEKNDMLDKLLIVPHNKFSEYILDDFPQYKNIICTNPSLALKYAKVFITDYSSAIYDAIYRKAYPVFYWEEKEELIKNYQAIPPINDENAPGPTVYNLNDLVKVVKKAIIRNYVLEEEYKSKYKRINQFDDNKNTKRIINYMIKESIV